MTAVEILTPDKPYVPRHDLPCLLPAVVDKIDDRVNVAYSGHPDRLYLVGKDGMIACVGGRGPGAVLHKAR